LNTKSSAFKLWAQKSYLPAIITHGCDLDVQTIYVYGSSHSGSTVLGSFLGAFHGLEMLGEVEAGLKKDGRKLCSCGETLEECKIWGPVLKANSPVEAGGRRRDREPINKETRRLLDYFSQVFSSPSAIVDTSKSLSRLRRLTIDRAKPLVLHLVRNPYAVVVSQMTSEARKGVARRSTAISLLEGWASKQREGRKFCRDHRVASLTVRFEDFVDDPRKVVESLSAIGVPLSGEIPDLIDPACQHQISGNRIRKGPPFRIEKRAQTSNQLMLETKASLRARLEISRYGYSTEP